MRLAWLLLAVIGSSAAEIPWEVTGDIDLHFTGRGLESTYKIVVGRSRCVTGPFVDEEGCSLLDGGGTRVIANSAAWRGPGHNAVLQDAGLTWIVYHALHPTRRPALTLRIDRVEWTEDGWPEVPQPPPPVTGYWEHRVAARPVRLLRLLPDGSIDVAGNEATWRLVDSLLELSWSSAATPGAPSVDRCTVSADRRTYAGRDADGRPMQGWRSVLGWWEHRVADGPATMLRLLPNGTINDAQRGATWVLTGDVLEMRRPDGSVARQSLRFRTDDASTCLERSPTREGPLEQCAAATHTARSYRGA